MSLFHFFSALFHSTTILTGWRRKFRDFCHVRVWSMSDFGTMLKNRTATSGRTYKPVLIDMTKKGH